MTGERLTWPYRGIRPQWLIRLPGVYRAQHDTWLLAGALSAERTLPGSRVLDLCTGSGALAVVAARRGAAHVTAVDISPLAVLSARLNATLRRVPVRVERGDLHRPGRRGYQFVVANPPYVPAAGTPGPRSRSWAAGPDGRSVLDRICAATPRLLGPDGVLLLVQSTLSDEHRTLRDLSASGLSAEVVARRRLPFGPVLRRQRTWLRRLGRIRPDQYTEELVVIRAHA